MSVKISKALLIYMEIVYVQKITIYKKILVGSFVVMEKLSFSQINVMMETCKMAMAVLLLAKLR